MFIKNFIIIIKIKIVLEKEKKTLSEITLIA
jgi:hypothetical protein